MPRTDWSNDIIDIGTELIENKTNLRKEHKQNGGGKNTSKNNYKGNNIKIYIYIYNNIYNIYFIYIIYNK